MTTVTNAIEQQVDVEAVLNEVFAGVITDRPRLQKGRPLAGAVNGLIDREVRAFVASDAFADILGQGQHQGATGLGSPAEGGGGDRRGFAQGDQVVLDVSEVIDQVKQRLVARGLADRAERPDPRRGQADRAAFVPGAGADDLCVRESGGQVADPGRGGALFGRSRCHAAGRG